MGLDSVVNFFTGGKRERTPEQETAYQTKLAAATADNPWGRRPRIGPDSATITGRTAILKRKPGDPTLATDKLAETDPVDAIKAESDNTDAAGRAAARARKRARGGHSGRVTAPGGTGARSGSSPRTLAGY